MTQQLQGNGSANARRKLSWERKLQRALNVTRAVLLVTLLGIGFWLVGRDVAAYLKYDTTTSIQSEIMPNMTFPAVTICNYNRWKLSSILASGVAKQRLFQQLNSDDALYEEDHEEEVYQNFLAARSRDFSSDDLTVETNATASSDENATAANHLDFNIYELTLRGGWKLTDAVKASKLTYYNNATLLSCTFCGVQCNVQFFKKIVTSYGSCYTFNQNISWTNMSKAQMRLGPKIAQRAAADNNGLSLVLNVETDEYYENRNVFGKPQLGIKVIVHSPDRPPNPDSQGISVSPGQHASVALHWTRYTYMEHPWGICNRTKKLHHFATYTYEGCLWECLKHAVLKQCSCTVYYQADSPVGVCTVNQSATCAHAVHSAIHYNPALFCDCPVACTQDVYDTRTHYATYPNPSMADGLAKTYNMTPNYYRSNIASVNIYFNEMNRKVISEVAKTSLEHLIGTIGGHLGLLTGFSFVAVVDLVEFVLKHWKEIKQIAKPRGNHGAASQSTRC